MFRRLYLDYSATTPVDPRVLDAMLPFLKDDFGNASSIHFFGQRARAAVDKARHQVAALINSRPNEVVFTSGGTEANNLAVRGLVQVNSKHGRHIVTSTIEHPSVRSVCDDLEKQGYEITRLPVNADGVINLVDLLDSLRPDTVLISVMAANNEIGTLQPITEVGRIVKELRQGGRKIWFHTDAVQMAGKLQVDVEEIGCDLLSISAHKIYAPKGVGALYIRSGTRLHSQNIGGRQERGTRGGTEPVPLVVGCGAACEIAREEMLKDGESVKNLRRRFEDALFERIPDARLNGHRELRVPGVANISFPGVEGEGLLINLDMQGIAVSTGAACSSGSLEPSPVIRALGCEDAVARSAVRFSFGRQTTAEDIDYLMERLPAAVDNLRRLSRPTAG